MKTDKADWAEFLEGKVGLGDLAVKKLLKIVDAGKLPDVYGVDEKAVHEWLFDFFPDLSWDGPNRIKDIDTILADSCFPRIQAFFQSRYGFDFRKELERGKE